MSESNKQVGGNHYKHLKIEPTEYAHANDLGFLEGNVVKYVTRHKDKGGAEDLKKAIHYIEMILEWEYKNKEESSVPFHTINYNML